MGSKKQVSTLKAGCQKIFDSPSCQSVSRVSHPPQTSATSRTWSPSSSSASSGRLLPLTSESILSRDGMPSCSIRAADVNPAGTSISCSPTYLLIMPAGFTVILTDDLPVSRFSIAHVLVEPKSEADIPEISVYLEIFNRLESRCGRLGGGDHLPLHSHRAQSRLKSGEPINPAIPSELVLPFRIPGGWPREVFPS